MSLDIAKHKNILIKILKEIFINASVGPFLGFKGGTAALLFFNLNRFSVDLDFDLIDEKQEDYIFNQIKNILEKYGKLKEAEKKRYSLFYLLSYDNKDVNAQNVKVEINLRNFNSRYTVESYLGISMKVMIKEDMFAHKIVAMYERLGRTNRDIFDVYFFFSHNWPMNKNIVESRTGMSYREFLVKLLDSLEKFDNKDILSGMGELLDERQKVWVKVKLKSETMFLLKLALENEK